MQTLSAGHPVGKVMEPRGSGDEAQTTHFEVTIENVSAVHDFASSGVFSMPTGSDDPGPLMPGQSYQAVFYAGPGARLSFASMFVQSNDLFFAPAGAGIALFDDGGDSESAPVDDAWTYPSATDYLRVTLAVQ